MTSREEQATGGATLTTPPLPGLDPIARTARPAAASRGSLTAWDNVFALLDNEQQQQLFRLVQQQGLLYEHQIAGGQSSHPSRRRDWLSAVMHGKAASLAPLQEQPLQFRDSDLDDDQRKAVARAVHSPDVFLLNCPPGSGTTRVIAEIIRQAAARGERILLLSPATAALDQTLIRIGQDDGVCALRCLSPAEQIDLVPEETRQLTLENRARDFQDHALNGAKASVSVQQDRLARGNCDRQAWEQLHKLAVCQENLELRIDALRKRQVDTEQAWQREIEAVRHDLNGDSLTPFQKKLVHCLRRKQSALSRLQRELHQRQKRLNKTEAELEQLRRDLEQLEPLVEARRRKRWWTRTWWKAKLQGNLIEEHQSLAARREPLEETVHGLQKEHQCIAEEHSAKEKEQQQHEDALIEEEKLLRRKELDREKTTLDHEGALIRRQWEECLALLSEASARPSEISLSALDDARKRSAAMRRENESRLRFAQRWAKNLEDAIKSFPARLARAANLVAATPQGLAQHLQFADGARLAIDFDLLIVAEAERIEEADLRGAGLRAQRHVLVGNLETESPGKASHSVLARLWERLRPDPRRLPVRWRLDEQRLCCRLIELTERQRPWIEREPVADREDVEVGILVEPDKEPTLAEVHFPSGMSIQEAKEYIFNELEGITAQTSGEHFECTEESGHVLVSFKPAPDSPTVVHLEPGVVELVEEQSSSTPSTVPFETVGFRFSHEHGWTCARAAEWIETNLGLRDSLRTLQIKGPPRFAEQLDVATTSAT